MSYYKVGVDVLPNVGPRVKLAGLTLPLFLFIAMMAKRKVYR